jgi:YVTN family beta-propeller protein
VPESAPSSLHAYVSRLRRALGRDRLLRNGHGYRLVVEPDELDLTRFEELLAAGRSRLEQGDPGGAAETLTAALALWQGPPLADFTYEPFARQEIERLEELHLDAVEERIDADLALGRHAHLVPELETLVREHPLREQLRRQLMLALYRSGRQAEALETYRRGRTGLVAELGLEPGPELQRLERQILSHDPALQAPATRARRELRRRWIALAAVGVLVVLGGVVAFVLTRGDQAPVSAGPNTIGVIDTDSNRLVASIRVGQHPVGIAYRGDDVWVANTDSGTVSRIDPKTREVGTIGIGSPTTDVVFAGRNIWTGNGSDGTLSEISPVTGQRIGGIELPGRRGLIRSSVNSLASGAGSLWAAMSNGVVLRVDPRTRSIQRRIHVAAQSIAYGGGALWALTRETRLVRIEPRINKTSGDQLLGVGPGESLAAAGSQVLAGFFPSLSSSAGVVERLDAESMQGVWSRAVEFPSAIAVGRGTVWAASYTQRTVYRIDAVSGRLVKTISVKGAPVAIAIVGSEVWVSIDQPEDEPEF